MPTQPGTDRAQAKNDCPDQAEGRIWRLPSGLLELEVPVIQDRQRRTYTRHRKTEGKANQQAAPVAFQTRLSRDFSVVAL